MMKYGRTYGAGPEALRERPPRGPRPMLMQAVSHGLRDGIDSPLVDRAVAEYTAAQVAGGGEAVIYMHHPV